MGGALVASWRRDWRGALPSRCAVGRYRAEIIGALVNGGFLLGMALLVIVMGAMRLASPSGCRPRPFLAL